MRDFISGAWHLLDGWGRVAVCFFLAGVLITLWPVLFEPSWDTALEFAEAVLVFVTVTGLMIAAAAYKKRLAQELTFRPLTRLGVDVMKGIAESENRSVMVHIAGDSYMIEPIGAEDEHE